MSIGVFINNLAIIINFIYRIIRIIIVIVFFGSAYYLIKKARNDDEENKNIKYKRYFEVFEEVTDSQLYDEYYNLKKEIMENIEIKIQGKSKTESIKYLNEEKDRIRKTQEIWNQSNKHIPVQLFLTVIACILSSLFTAVFRDMSNDDKSYVLFIIIITLVAFGLIFIRYDKSRNRDNMRTVLGNIYIDLLEEKKRKIESDNSEKCYNVTVNNTKYDVILDENNEINK